MVSFSFPSNDNFSVRPIAGSIGLACAAYCWYKQYGRILVLKAKGLPKSVDHGWPLLGCISFLWEGLQGYAKRSMRSFGVPHTCYVFGEHVAVLDWELWERFFARAEEKAELEPHPVSHLRLIFGVHSLMSLPGGKGPAGARHRRLRAKLMQALSPKQSLLMVPRIEAAVRQMLDECARETAVRGECSMKPHIERFGCDNAVVSALGDLGEDVDLLKEMQGQFRAIQDAFLSVVHVDLPIFAFGRAMDARRAMAKKVSELMCKANTHSSQRNALARMTKTDADGTGLNEEEVVDIIVQVLIAGVVTVSHTIPHLVVNLAKHPEWARRIADEAKARPWSADTSIEAPTSDAVKYIRENLRLWPPIHFMRRGRLDGAAVDLAEHGVLPPGLPVCTYFTTKGDQMDGGQEIFDPDRWTAEEAKGFIGFGHGPHHCAGKYLAMVELQVLVRILTSGEYSIEVLDDEVVPDDVAYGFKGGLRVRVSKCGP